MKKLFPVLLVSALAGCADPLLYEAQPKDGQLMCCVLADQFHRGSPQMPQKGSSDLTGAMSDQKSDTITQNGTLAMALTAPNPITDGTNPSMGLFLTELNFRKGNYFTARATFRNPHSPPSGKGWSVGVTAREGVLKDDIANPRVSVTLTTANSKGSRLRVRENDITHDEFLIPQETLDKIFDPASPQPFELDLDIDRISGIATGTIRSGTFSKSLSFHMYFFSAYSTNVVTVVGPTLANCCADGEQVSVEVTDFNIVQGYRLYGNNN